MTEIAAGVYGAWRLARRDPAGLIWFDDSQQGFWHSFWAAVLVLPGFIVLQIIDGSFADDLARPLAVHLIAYVIGWVAYPLAIAHIADAMGRRDTYIRYIVAYNWSAVIQMAAFLPVALAAHLFPGPGTALLQMGITVVLLFYQAYIGHVALGVAPLAATALVLFDLMLSGLVESTINRLLQIP